MHLPAHTTNAPERLDVAFGINVEMSYETSIIDAKTGIAIKRSGKKKNLVMDLGLNAFAKSTHSNTIAEAFSFLQIGSGTNANSFASGAITFTQATTTVTASGGFFTAAMVGGILKYGASGSAGTEQYITAFTDSTHVTVSSSATVASTQGTLWMVQQTSLQTFLFATNQYRTLGGDNSTTYSAGQQVMKRTFINPVQVAPYNVNELGWYFTSTSGVFGRVTLSSTDVVPPTAFYQVVMTMTVTFAPNAPLAVGNVGTGFNSAGNIMIEWFGFAQVLSTGAADLSNSILDSASTTICAGVFVTGTAYTQQTSLVSTTVPFTYASGVQLNAPGWTYVGGSVGVCTHTSSVSTTTTGQTCVGIGLQRNSANALTLDCKLTTPFALPNGIFQPQMIWQCTYGRTLTN